MAKKKVLQHDSIAEQLNTTGNITLDEVLEMHGIDDVIKTCFRSMVPAMCTEGCEVEPDGKCPHGNKSILIVAGWV